MSRETNRGDLALGETANLQGAMGANGATGHHSGQGILPIAPRGESPRSAAPGALWMAAQGRTPEGHDCPTKTGTAHWGDWVPGRAGVD